ncbi:HK97 family phage prohead protease [Kitasatospora aureofaciens]|uniref:HK97 family phage prohead protease n=1 Tax=Kitasatospora aureofaciens TaxID=1894 RepID=UPI0036F480B2
MNRRAIPGTGVQYRTVPLQQLNVRAEGDEGTFEGVACRYGVVDSYGTVFKPGVFRKGGLDQGTYALLDMHDPGRPIGTFTAREKGDHLAISGRYDDTQAGRDARARALSGSAPELSVGFIRTDMPATWEEYDALTDKQKRDLETNIRSARLVEVSQITARMAAVPGSALTGVRTAAHVRAADADEDPSALVASLDGILDQAVQLAGEYPREGLPEEVAQALDLLVAAEAVVDQVMDVMGIYDPDDQDDSGSGEEPPPADGAASAALELERAKASAALLLAGLTPVNGR